MIILLSDIPGGIQPCFWLELLILLMVDCFLRCFKICNFEFILYRALSVCIICDWGRKFIFLDSFVLVSARNSRY